MKPTRTKRSACRTEKFGWRLVMALFVSGLILPAGFASAESFTENFNSPNPSWKVTKSDQHVKTLTHRRSPDHGKDSVGEQVVVKADRPGQTIRIEHTLPKARVLNELEVGVWVRPDAPGLQVHLRVTLPGCEDPDGRTVSMRIPGDIAEEAGEWQRLTCRTDDKLVQKELQLLRAKHRSLTPKVMVVDRVILTWPLSAGVAELSLDELTFGPLVRIEESEIAQTGHEQEFGGDHPVQFRLDRMEVEGKPFFPRIVPYHGEPLKNLAAAGFNVVLMPDYSDQALLRSVREAGLWATATPPTVDGTDRDAGEAGLIPFSAETRSIAFWMLGTRISPQSQNRLVKWVDQIQEADQKFRRPLAADVSGDESLFSRELDLIGISRHTMGSSLTLRDYRDWMIARRASARPGSLCFTWIQVTPPPAVASVWEQHQIPLQLEPEQIRLQVYAALAAGMRGLGFWTHRALNEDNKADRETLLALHQINWELWLLEPWLATASGVSRIPLTIEVNSSNKAPAKPQSKLNFSKKSNQNNNQLLDPTPSEPEPKIAVDPHPPGLSAAVLRTTDKGTLLLPMWLEDRSQFVPGQLAANKVSMVVPGIPETAAAWEITTTGIHGLDSSERQQVSGGVKITLKNFDQTSCVLLTSDRVLIEETRQRIASITEQSARNYLALADLKLERVRVIDQVLGESGLRQYSGPHILGQARIMYGEAREALSNQDWQKVRLGSKQALQLARTLQREHWEDAVRNLPSPVASPYAISFQSLPMQARLATQLANENATNLLPTGNFEDADALFPVGWKHEQDAPDYVQAEAEFSHESHRGKYCLRLHSKLTSSHAPATTSRSREFVRILTPPVTVHAGHAVRIAGWIKLPAEISGTQDGVMIYDSLFGRNLALRFRETCDWQRFELVREAAESRDVTVTIALTGLGEVSVDDLQITVHPLTHVQQASTREPASPPRSAAPTRPWSGLRRLNPLPTRRNVPKP